MRRFSLRLLLDSLPSFLQSDGCFCHGTLASFGHTNCLQVRMLPSSRVLLHADLQYYHPFRRPDTCQSHFPFTVIGIASSMRFLHRVSRASPVSTSSFPSCRR